MSDYMHSICREIDPEDVERLMTNKKHSARQKIIKKYLIKCYTTGFKNIQNKNDYILIKNTFNFCKLVVPLTLLFSIISYKYFFTGVYEFRNFYMNTANIPFIFKFIFSAGLGYIVFDHLWMNYAYNEEVYELAVRDLMLKHKLI